MAPKAELCYNGGVRSVASAGEFQNRVVDMETNNISGFQGSTEPLQQGDEFNAYGVASPLGLTLSKTPSFLNLVDMVVHQARIQNSPSETNHEISRADADNRATMNHGLTLSQPTSEKLKASNFPASFLKIGSWERSSQYEEDLIAKCYYAKKKLVWEVLEGPVKSKMEIQWSDIEAIRAIIHEDEPGILEIEINHPPLFFKEINPQPRKHTLWQPTNDFTGGQALSCRRHRVQFSPGVLDKHYEKLLQCDHRLLELSQKSFPSMEFPCSPSNFYPSNISFVTTWQPHALDSQQVNPISLVHPHPFQNFHLTSNSLFQATNSGQGDEDAKGYMYENQGEENWGVATMTQGGQDPKSVFDVRNSLLNDLQFDNGKLLSRVRSMCSLLDSSEETSNPPTNMVINHLEYIQEDNSILGTSENFEVDGGMIYPMPIHSLPMLDYGQYESMDPMVGEYKVVDTSYVDHQWR